ncbi:MAG: HEAT repeat domain-containing protein [Planctomycetota bacterium]|nr:HEAT repeat domain-containing protein [Planctomycetota bacterium]
MHFVLALSFSAFASVVHADDLELVAKQLFHNYTSFGTGMIEVDLGDEDNVVMEFDHDKIRALLQKIGVESRVILPQLFELLHNDADEWHKWYDYFKEMQGEAVPFLVKELSNEDPEIRFHAIWALEWIGREAEPAVPAIIELIDDEQFSDSALDAIVEIGQPRDAVLASLVRSVEKYPDGNFTFDRIFQLGPQAAPAIPVVVKATQNPSTGIRGQALYTLSSIDDSGVTSIPVLIDALTDSEHNTDSGFYAPPVGLPRWNSSR